MGLTRRKASTAVDDKIKITSNDETLKELVRVNLVSVKIKYAQDELIEAQQFPQDTPGGGESIQLSVEQVIHLTGHFRLNQRMRENNNLPSGECPYLIVRGIQAAERTA
jgi:hypothetical protein